MTAAHIADHVVVILPFGAGALFGYFTKQQSVIATPLTPVLFRPPAAAGFFANRLKREDHLPAIIRRPCRGRCAISTA
jgi:hypothetical protein